MHPVRLLRQKPPLRKQLVSTETPRFIHTSTRDTQAVAKLDSSDSAQSQGNTALGPTINGRRTDPSSLNATTHAQSATSSKLVNSTHPQLRWTGTDLILDGLLSSDASIRISQWWLRDHCPCAICMNQVTRQRQANNLLDINKRPRIRNVRKIKDRNLLQVEWSDDHQSIYDQNFIPRKHSPILEHIRQGNVPIELWGSSIGANPPTIQYQQLQAGAYGDMMKKIRIYGFCLIEGMPATAAASEAVLKDIGPIRETHYGGFYVFTADLKSKDTAYTSEALEPHNDNTYFTDAAGLQMLHVLSHEQGSGGESLFIDGFNVARQLFEEEPDHFEVLSTYGVYSQSTGNDGINIQPLEAVPVLRHDGTMEDMVQVRWNNADRAGIDASQDKMDKWYEAASKFQQLLDRETNRWWTKLRPGTPIIYDNWRLLHGRSAFTGIRTVCGGYINRDDFISKYKTTNCSDADLLASTVSG